VWISLAIMGVGLVLLTPVLASTWTRMTMAGTTFQDVMHAESQDRWAVSRAGLSQFAAHPLLGVGPLEIGFHNSYVDMLVCYGLVGVCPVLLMLGSAVRIQWRGMRHNSDDGYRERKKKSMAVLLSLLTWMIVGVTLGAQKELTFWAILGLGLARWKKPESTGVDAHPLQQRFRQYRRRVHGLRMSPS
jgi:O-antigen ligase